jgi:hypothetical protein
MSNANIEIRRTAKDTLNELRHLVNVCDAIEEHDNDLRQLIRLIQNSFYNAKPIKNEKKKIIEYSVIIPESDWNKIINSDTYSSISMEDELT